jgi:L-alanine-DL-glutamate epimerase-like enolase superfamily enzyme
MTADLTIVGIEVHEFEREIQGMRNHAGSPIYDPGYVWRSKAYAVRILTRGGTVLPVETAPIRMVASLVLGQNALEHERIYNDTKRILRHVSRMGLAHIDNALWDLAGKYYSAPIFQLLGGYRERLPVYASTTRGDFSGGLDTPEAYADFAQQCLEMGHRGYKIHPWWGEPISREVELIHAVGRRVGGKVDIMIDPGCVYKTFGDALKVGRACDEENFFWLEDPFLDGGVSQFAHRKLRQLVKTPLLQAEHIRGLEPRIDFLLAGGTDFVRGDVRIDGITCTMKLAHAAEALGVDVEMHLGGPETRHCMASMRNCNYLEWGLVNPKLPRDPDSFYRDGYADGLLDGIDPDGCVAVPKGPG